MTAPPTANILLPAGELQPGDRIMVDGQELTVKGWEAYGPPGHVDNDLLAIHTDSPGFSTLIRNRGEVMSVLIYT